MILVTGGTGLVGSRLLYDLAKNGKTIRALKRESSSTELFDKLIKEQKSLSKNIEWIDGDLLDVESLELALEDVDIVYHCAATVSFDPKLAKKMEEINIEGTANLVNLCIEKNDINYFCHVSSVSTLGRLNADSLLDENNHWIPGNHNSNYGISKYGAEREVWRGIAEGLKAVIINPTIILGPGKWHSGSSEIFLKVKNKFPFYTDGESGFVDVRDVSDAMLFLTEKNIIGERFILNAENISFHKLFEMIAEELLVKKPSIHVTPLMSSIVWRLEKIRSLFTGKSPFITKGTAYSAHQIYRYNADKIKSLGFNFRSLKESIEYTCKELKNSKI